MHSQEPGSEGPYSDALSVKAIVPEKVQHDGREKIAIIFNHRLNLKTKERFFVDFVGAAGAVQVPATLANSSTLVLETPVYKQPSVVTAYVYHGIHRRLLGQHRFEFLSRNDTFYRLLYGALDPISFMCEALRIASGDIHDLDYALAETFLANAPEGFDFIGHHGQGTVGQSSAEYPTLLHFASKFGLSRLIEVILRYPGAYEACSMKNCHGYWPYNIAENHGYHQLANDLRAFCDQRDPDGYVKMKNESQDVYVKMQREDGSYCFVLRKEGNELYTDVDNKDGQEECYVKMVKASGGYYYMPMKPGVGPKRSADVNKKQYINVKEQDGSEAYQEDVYENINKPTSGSNDDQGGQEIYEDMEHGGNPTGDGHSGDEDFYVTMDPEEQETTEKFYIDMQPAEENPSDLYMAMDPGVSSLDALQNAFQQGLKSGKLSNKEVSDFTTMMEKIGFSDRRGSTASKNSTSTTSSTGSSGSSGISSSSEHEFMPYEETIKDVENEEEEEEEATHASRDEILSQIRGPRAEDAPPPPPQVDYLRKEKTTGHARRSKTVPVEEKDLQGVIKASSPQHPPPVQRRRSTPAGAASNLQVKEPGRLPQPIPESAPPRTAPRPAPRPPVSPLSDTTRAPAPVPPSERIRQSGVPVLPMPTARSADTPPRQPPRRQPQLPPQRSPRN